MNATQKSYLALHIAVLLYGLTAILGDLIDLPAFTLVWWRVLITSFSLLFLVNVVKLYRTLPRRDIINFSLIGVIIAIHWLTFFGAIKASNVSVTLAVLSTGAFFASILEPLIYGRKVILYEVLFGLVVVAGLYVIFDVEASYTLGIVLALISAFLSALFSVINGKFVLKHKASAISFYELMFGVLGITIYLAFSGSFTADFFKVSASDWIYLLILGPPCS